MDDVWRTISLKICFYIRPDRWWWADWIRITLGCGFVGWAASHCPDRRLATFWQSVLGSAFIGMVGCLIAVNSHYLLLIQASPYRTLWLLELLALPAGYGLAAHLWQRGSQQSRSASLVVVLLLTLNWDGDLWAYSSMILISLLGFAVLCRGFARIPRNPDWLWRSTQTTFIIVCSLMFILNVIQLIVALRAQPFDDFGIHPASIAMNAYRWLFSLPLLILFLLSYHYLGRITGRGSRYRLRLLVFCAGYQCLIVCAPYSDWYARHFDVHNRHVRFVGSKLSTRVAGRCKPFTVYWPTSVNDIWFGTGNNSYYNIMQMTGCAFNRGTAVEGYHRAASGASF